MEHVREIELIELAAGRLDAPREQGLRDHLAQCAQCRERFEGLQRTWDLLGAWEVHPPKRFDSDKAPPEEGDVARPVIRLFSARMALRFAAAIVVTVAAGYTGGWWSVRRASAGAGSEPPQYISALGLGVGESLSSLVLQDDSLPAEEG